MDLVLRNSYRVLTTLALLLVALSASPAHAQRAITVASTTSTEQSGLFKYILPKFTGSTGIEVRVVALGTGQALDIGRRGDADVVFVHDKEAEEKFVADGFGVTRQGVMYNDFVVVGPKSDPAGAAGKDIHAALRRIGQGMGPALNTASAASAYVISDRGTWLAFRNRGELTILVEGDQRMFNQYGIMLVNPARHSQVKAADGQSFIDWLVSGMGQKAIAEYRINGEQLFFPNAGAAGKP
jgi:tungstate transport system substrate-binding protein